MHPSTWLFETWIFVLCAVVPLALAGVFVLGFAFWGWYLERTQPGWDYGPPRQQDLSDKYPRKVRK